MAVFGRQLRLRPAADANVLRARLEDAGDEPREVARPDTAGGRRGEISLDNILLLIPGDIVSIYLSCKGLVAPAGQASFLSANWQLIWFLACLVACFGFRMMASKPVGATGLLGGANWSMAFWTTVAFFLWAHAVSESGPVIAVFAGSYAAPFAALFGLAAPQLVRSGT